MVECGSIDTPPSRSNMTIWGIVELVVMCIIGLSCAGNVIDILNYGTIGTWAIISLIGSGFGVAGLVFVILGLVYNNANYLRIGMICFFISIIIALVCLVFSILYSEKIYFSTLVTACFKVFLAYVLWRQSGHLSA